MLFAVFIKRDFGDGQGWGGMYDINSLMLIQDNQITYCTPLGTVEACWVSGKNFKSKTANLVAFDSVPQDIRLL